MIENQEFILLRNLGFGLDFLKYYEFGSQLNHDNSQRIEWKIKEFSNLVDNCFLEAFYKAKLLRDKKIDSSEFYAISDKCISLIEEMSENVPEKNEDGFASFRNKALASVVYLWGCEGRETLVNRYAMLITK